VETEHFTYRSADHHPSFTFDGWGDITLGFDENFALVKTQAGGEIARTTKGEKYFRPRL